MSFYFTIMMIVVQLPASIQEDRSLVEERELESLLFFSDGLFGLGGKLLGSLGLGSNSLLDSLLDRSLLGFFDVHGVLFEFPAVLSANGVSVVERIGSSHVEGRSRASSLGSSERLGRGGEEENGSGGLHVGKSECIKISE